jgi:hypothetical protein
MAMTLNKKQSITGTVQFDKNDPLWNETPTIGVEGLIAFVDNKTELRKKLIEVNEYHKKLKIGIT